LFPFGDYGSSMTMKEKRGRVGVRELNSFQTSTVLCPRDPAPYVLDCSIDVFPLNLLPIAR
jgi:hypothetical protein